MKPTKSLFLFFLLAALILSACGASSNDAAAKAVENYYQAVVAKDADKAAAFSCADWETNAKMEVDSLQSVEAELTDFSCSVTGKDGNYTLVTCEGEISMSYNGEAQSLDLSRSTYQVIRQNGDWLFCGYHQ